MRYNGFKIVIVVLFVICLRPAYSQCKMENKVMADGTMMYYFEPDIFTKQNLSRLK